MIKQVWFVRHGQSVMNAGGWWADSATIPLTETGHAQARAVSGVLNHNPDLIVTSSYTRTLETARPTMARWPDAKHEEWEIHEFDYLCGQTRVLKERALFEQHHQAYWERNDPHYQDGPSAESYTQLMKRVDTVITRLHENLHAKTIAFSHALFLKALLYRIENMDHDLSSIADMKSMFYQYMIDNTAIAHLTVNVDGTIKINSLSSDHVEE